MHTALLIVAAEKLGEVVRSFSPRCQRAQIVVPMNRPISSPHTCMCSYYKFVGNRKGALLLKGVCFSSMSDSAYLACSAIWFSRLIARQ
jgi:hypothetical protein